MGCCDSCSAKGSSSARVSSPICAVPGMVLSRDAKGRPVCSRPGSSSVTAATCPPGMRLEDTPQGWVCVPEDKRPTPWPTDGNSQARFAPERALTSAAPLPYSAGYAARIRGIVGRRVTLGQTAPARLTATVLAEVYPVTHDRVEIDWTNLPATAATCLLELRRLVRAQVDLELAALALGAARQRYASVAAAGGGQ